MSSTAESDCDCLPDCELMDLQYSVSTTNFMWVMQDLLARRGSGSIQSSRICGIQSSPSTYSFWVHCGATSLCDGILFIGQPLFWADSPFWSLSGNVTPATSTWTPSACWRQDQFLRSGLKGWSKTNSCNGWFSVLISGERDLQQIRQLNSLLHLNLGRPNEEEAQGPPACHWVKGKALSSKCLTNIFFQGWLLQCLGGGHCCC